MPALGLIAGNRRLPFELAQLARKAGETPIVVAAFEGETDPSLSEHADVIAWFRVGQLSKLIRFFHDHKVERCVMAGQIAPKNLFQLRPDLRASAMLFKLKERNAHTLFGAIGDELAKDGIHLIEATPWLRPLMPEAGFLLGRKLNASQWEQLSFALRVAKEVSRLEIGQSVVVKRGTILAVEGFEGTDACLARGGGLAGSRRGAVAVKVAKDGHDMRFDIPCIGLQTVETCLEHGVDVLGFEPGRVLILEQDLIQKRLHRQSFSLCAAI